MSLTRSSPEVNQPPVQQPPVQQPKPDATNPPVKTQRVRKKLLKVFHFDLVFDLFELG